MVYIHVKKVGDKKYYTLRLSVRKNNKVITRDLENLGTDISKIRIEDLEKKYKKEIRKSYKVLNKFLQENKYVEQIKRKKIKKDQFFTKNQLEEIEAARLHFKEKFAKLDSQTQQETYHMFLIKFAVSSTSIEGNTITLEEAYKLLIDEILPKNKTLREVYDLQNTEKVFFELLEKKPEISLSMIEEIHDKLLENIDKRLGYRTHDLTILGQPFKPSPGRYVKADMKMLIDWYNKQKKITHPLALAVFFHHKFENIHPFSDGNGRTGRILLNHILIRSSYPPLIIPKKFRSEYIDVLNTADKAIRKNLLYTELKHHEQLFSFVVEQFRSTYWNTFLT
ncbi:MAG: hypothetical protein CMH61_00375 [Nanoarchaeota archaeon]|nr:hypothetical protein [Nanoarchaeota archaeon]|tara:strand:- start:1949 stop:2959 length:1011 start_codon:yes stop_codon:yes gene_type:complete